MQCDDRMPPSLCTSATSAPSHLALAQTAAQLAHGLDDAEQAAGRAGMGVRQHAAVRVDRQLAADPGVAFGEERAALARLAEAELLQLDDRHDGEAVVELAPRRCPADRARPSRRRCGPTRWRRTRSGSARTSGARGCGTRRCPAGTPAWTSVAGALGGGDDEGAAGVGDQAAVQHAERIGDRLGVEHVLQRDRLLHVRVGMQQRVARGC